MQNKTRLFAVLLKAILLIALFNFAFIYLSDIPFGNFSLYNRLFPGRERLPFGDHPQAYNINLFDLDAMFASHVLAGTPKAPDEYRVLLIGDSSVWGTLLRPQETLAGQLRAMAIPACGKTAHVYNLGYPYISLMQELMILDEALQYQPDMVVWLITLESLPTDKQFGSPLVANNPERVRELIAKYGLNADPNDETLVHASKWDQTFVSQRRALANLLRLQIYGAMWAATGIDQYYPESYERAQIDLEASDDFHKLKSLENALAWDVLDAGMRAVPNTILINEPILVSNGLNSDIRYNFFYPRWAFDEYRVLLNEFAVERNLPYLDLWDIAPIEEFTNSGVHLTPAGEEMLADKIAPAIQNNCNQ
jgi:lysophospholipase L1-like esterase